MPVTLVQYNPYNPVCTVDACLNQVVGYLDNKPLAQYASCTSLYGAPVVSTVTASPDVVFETVTSTVPYVDVTVEFTTTESTAQEISTSYDTVLQTETAYTTTIVATVTQTAVSTVIWNGGAAPQKRNLQRRGGCKPRSSSVSSSPEPSSTDAATSTSGAAEATSSAEAPSSSAPSCTDSAQHFSACACINAVSSVSTATEAAASASTSTIHKTVISTSLSTSISTVTLAVTTVVVRPATTTLISTVETEKATTTTVASTSISFTSNPTLTASWRVASPESMSNRAIGVTASAKPFLRWAGVGTSAEFSMVLSVGTSSQPYLASDSNLKLYAQFISSSSHALVFNTPNLGRAPTYYAVFCTADASTGLVSCLVESLGWTRMLSCGNDFYMMMSGYQSNSGCTDVQLKISPWFN